MITEIKYRFKGIRFKLVRIDEFRICKHVKITDPLDLRETVIK